MAQVRYAAVHDKMYADYTQDEYAALLVDQEWELRQHRKIKNITARAAFKLNASIRDIDYIAQRGLDRNYLERLLTLDFIKQRQNIIITGSTGVEKVIWRKPSEITLAPCCIEPFTLIHLN